VQGKGAGLIVLDELRAASDAFVSNQGTDRMDVPEPRLDPWVFLPGDELDNPYRIESPWGH
jgi:hypothetical protein